MGLMQMAIETYNNCSNGEYEEGKEPLAPIGFTATTANIEITIDRNGKFINAKESGKEVIKNGKPSREKETVIIPATEASLSRTTGVAPHALCDQVLYLFDCSILRNKGEEYVKTYIQNLSDWAFSEYSLESIKAVLKYVTSGTVKKDLIDAKFIPTDEEILTAINNKDSKQLEKFNSQIKQMVIWRVLGEEEPAVWKDQNLMKKYKAYYENKTLSENKTDICMISGEEEIVTDKLPKIKGNAKLISSNDTKNFTFRGRFTEAKEALTVGFESSQKAHSTIKWLIANYGMRFGDRTFLCWAPNNIHMPSQCSPFLEDDEEPCFDVSTYDNILKKKIAGYKSEFKDNEDLSKVIVTSFQAATDGRLSIISYDEMKVTDFFETLKQWDEECAWFHRNRSISSPALDKIISYAFGREQENKKNQNKPRVVVVKDNILAHFMSSLINCRLGQSLFPTEIEKALVRKASNPLSYKDNYPSVLWATCAVIRKYRKDHFGEEWNMELEKDKKDRSYQFGRLLAVYEKMERNTYDKDSNRTPNAVRLQIMYCNKPLHYAFELKKLIDKGYTPKLTPGKRVEYTREIEDIMSMLSEYPREMLNKPLGDTYLLGYSLESKFLYQTQKDKKNNNDNEENN